MSSIEKSIEVNAPVNAVYNQWTQFEEFPQFMEGVEQVQQLDDKRLHWRAEIGSKDKEWDAEIVEQVPDQRVAWRSTSGTPNGGVVSFQPLDANRTMVTLHLDYEPEGFLESIGDKLGVVSRRVQGDLERFKTFIEARGGETGGWRGEIHGGAVEGSTSTSGSTTSTYGSTGASTTGYESSGSVAESGMTSDSTTSTYGSTGTTSDVVSGSNVASYETSGTVSGSGMTSGTTTGGTSEIGEASIPVIEEELRVGKREVETGGVRVNTSVEEVPVQEQVNLREEHVEVERRPINRPASDADFSAVQEGTLEVRERSEEAVVSKEARVVEEVAIRKDVGERTETIQDTVRRTDVDVEGTGGSTGTMGSTGTTYTSSTDVTGSGTTGLTGDADSTRRTP